MENQSIVPIAPSPEDYTVGWLSINEVEYLTAQAYLDVIYGQFTTSPPGGNRYSVGKIGGHNIIIGGLSGGVTGATEAADLVKQMLVFFPGIKIVLSVGIGSGAPSVKHDIRLGDIVVGASSGGNGGVIHFDSRGAKQVHSFEDSVRLYPPLKSLLLAVDSLEAQYKVQGHRLEMAINSALRKDKILRRNYKRPKLGTDKLFKPTFDHNNCGDVCSNDPLNLISRPERTRDNENPTIHYGFIASGSLVTKDAVFRDRLSYENDIICLDMNAVGLMNRLPCIVIRGISDYFDSHSNGKWEWYAAMAAAAYAKDLLSQIPSRSANTATTSGFEVGGSVNSSNSTTYSRASRVSSRDPRTATEIQPTAASHGGFENERFSVSQVTVPPHGDHGMGRTSVYQVPTFPHGDIGRIPVSEVSVPPRTVEINVPVVPRIKACYIFCTIMGLVVIGSGVLGIYCTVRFNKMGDGFTAAGWIVAIGALTLAGPFARHYPHCSCWSQERPYYGSLHRANTLPTS